MTGQVVYLDREPNGLAAMLGGLIEGNLASHPERQRLVNGRAATYTIVVSDVGAAASLRLASGRVLVRNGPASRPDVEVRTDSNTLIGLSSVPLRFGLPDGATKEGRETFRALLSRRLRVRGLLTHPARLARLNGLLSVN